MQSRQTSDVVLQALHMAVWRRKPKRRMLIHSDQGSQFTSMDWAAFIRTIGLARLYAKLTLANLAYNFELLIFHERCAATG
jgi:transposase InsO family protein